MKRTLIGLVAAVLTASFAWAAPEVSVSITIPDDRTVVPNSTTNILLEGTTVNCLGMLEATNSLGGALSQTVAPSWLFPSVPLEVGVNVFTVTVTNALGVAATDKVTVIRQAEASTGALRIATFSDPHYFAPSLLINDGSAFQTYLTMDRKLIAESAAITKATVDQIIAQNANFVFVTGDLTKDGELDSHVAFSNELARIEAAGAQVFVIPGNHDIDNPEAASYDGDIKTQVPSVSPTEFKAIYGPFGYDMASATDLDSVGYVADLTPTLTLVCMDSTQYGNRTYGSFTNNNRLAWITNQLTVAQVAGKLTLGMMHHGLLEHFPGQKQLFSDYVLDDYQTVTPLFASLGMKAVFTGHFHANDIVAATFSGKTIYDIETGSTVTYPCPFRVMELGNDGILQIETDTITAIDYDLGSAPDFPTYAYDYLNDGMLVLSQGMLMAPPYNLDGGTAAYVAPAVTEALLHHYAGDEPGFAGASAQTQGIVATLFGGDPLAVMLGQAIYSILTDTAPSDNTLALDLTPPILAITAPTTGASFPVDAASVSASIVPTGCVGSYLFVNTTMGVTNITIATTASLPLQSGQNQIVVSGTNALGWVAAATVTVTRVSVAERQLTLGVSGSVSVPNAEIVAYDATTKRAFVTCADQGIQIVDLSSPFAPKVIGSVLPGELVNSVAVKNGLVAAAVENVVRSNPGEVVFMDTTGTVLKRVTVGIQPDMVTFTPDGSKVVTADEAETAEHADYGAGSVSVIDLSGGVASATATVLGFEAFDSQTNVLIAAGVRLFAGRLPSVDFEPEYVAIAPDGQTAMVTLQENNAMAKIDLNTLTITAILPLGLKDHSLPGNGLDASDKDGPTINIANWPVFGMYMPDAVASFVSGGQTYYITANEGDIRDMGSDEARISTLTLDATAFPNAATLKLNANLGRLYASAIDGDVDRDGDIDKLHIYGARSFSIWGSAGNLVFDSGDALARTTAAVTPTLFNANNGSASEFDLRSDDKGCEPEGVKIATINGCTYAFIALERAGGGIMAYDVTAPTAPVFLQYARRNGDVAPEGLEFVSAEESPNGKALLLVANENSQTLTVYEVEVGGHLHVLSGDTTVAASEATYTVTGTAGDIAGVVTWVNAQSGTTGTASMVNGNWSASVHLIYGLNTLTFSGVNAQGVPFSDMVTVTRSAPTPTGGTNVAPNWNSSVATGAVHIAWTTNDWYQFQTDTTCLPGTFQFRDPFGGAVEPGDGEPVALTLGATHFRYDAVEGARYIVVENDGDLNVEIPLYDMPALCAPRTHDVWVRISYWDAPGNPEWVQNWMLGVTLNSGSATTPELMGRARSGEGLITEAYAFTVTGEASAVGLSFSANPALSFLNAAYVSEITVDTRVTAPIRIASPVEGDTVASSTEYATVAVATDGLVGMLTFRNETTGHVVTVPAGGRGRAQVALGYGLNIITVTGTDSQARTVTATVTLTRNAPPPANGTTVAPDWNYTVATGAVHVAWTTNDWYQLQRSNTCLPGTFQYRDPFGGTREPGAGEPDALTQGFTHFRYDAQDNTRCAVVEQNWDLSFWVPCYGSSVAGVPMNQRVWLQVSYWDAPGNPQWIQDWDIAPYVPGSSVSTPVLMGRTHGADGLITEAYAFTVTGDASGFFLDLAASPALSAINPAYLSDVRVDVLAEPGILAHRILTTIEGNGIVSAGNILVAHGASTNIVLTAAAWHRIQTLTTNSIVVAEAAGNSTYTLAFTGLTGDYNNHVVFSHRADALNPELDKGGHVPTAWLAQFGRTEAEPFVTSDRSIGDKYLLNLTPYQTVDVQFDVEAFVIEDGLVRATVRLLVGGQGHPAVNGTLQLEGKVSLDDVSWTPLSGTSIPGATFTNGRRTYDEVPAAGYRFFRVTVR